MNDLGEYRCINCSWAMRVEDFEHRRPAGTMNCPDCSSTIRGYEEMLYSTSLTEFLKDGNR